MIELTDMLGMRETLHSIHPMIMSTQHHPMVQATTDWLWGIVIEQIDPKTYDLTMWLALFWFVVSVLAVLTFVSIGFFGAAWWIMLLLMGLCSVWLLVDPALGIIKYTCRYSLLVALYLFSLTVGIFKLDSDFWMDVL